MDLEQQRRLVAESLTIRAARAGTAWNGWEPVATEKWRAWADLALFNAACANASLTSDEVWALLAEHNIEQPWEPKVMSGVMTAGQRRGWTERTDVFCTNPVPATHRHKGRAQRVWTSALVGTTPAAWPE